MEISVVVPVYGCRAALIPLYERLTKTLQTITESYEIILVDDHCPQNSWLDIKKLCDQDKKVVGIKMARNFGQIKAITAGLDYSSGQKVVVMDCDLQDQPEEIINLYNKSLEGYDVVFARRKDRKDGFFKVLVSKIFYKVYSFATDGNYDPALCNFSMISRQVVDSYCSMRELHRAYVIYIKWLGFNQTSIDVQHEDRFEGKSSYNFKKRIQMAFDILTSQSDKLLKLTAQFGFVVTLLSLFVIVYLVINHFVNDVMVGWTSIIAVQFLIGGLIIMVVGLIGIYIGNIFMQVKERPLYITKKVINKEEL